MATIKLKFRPSSVPETEGTLYYQVIHKRKVKWISTGYHVYPCEWDEKAGEMLIPPNSERKAELEQMQSQINWELKQWDSIVVEMGNQHKNITINELCDAFNKTKVQKTVFMFLQEQVTKKEQMKRQGTAMTYSNAYRRFKEFREGQDLTFDELTPDMMECYEAWRTVMSVSVFANPQVGFVIRVVVLVIVKDILQKHIGVAVKSVG